MTHRFVLPLLLLALTACSTFEPAYTTDDRFVQPEYEISIGLPPAPWVQADRLPLRFLPSNGLWESSLGAFSETVFLHEEQDSAIALEIVRIPLDLGAKPPQFTENMLKRDFKRDARRLHAMPFFSDHAFRITVPYIDTTPRPILYETFTMKSRGVTYRGDIRTCAYTMDGDDTCLLTLTLWSAPEAFDANRARLDQLVASLRRETGPYEH